MKILVCGLNYAPEPIGIAVYTSGMAEALVAMGHEVRVIAGQPYYPQWRTMAGFSPFSFSRRHEGGVDVLRVPHLVPRRPTGRRRLLQHLSFATCAVLPALWQALRWRPDVVIGVAPSLVAAPVALAAARVAGAVSWLHVQDFEVDAAFATGLLEDSGPVARLARWFEASVMRCFDMVSAISPQMCRKLIEKDVPAERIAEFRNWSDMANVEREESARNYRELWSIRAPHVVLYSGNLAQKQGLDLVVEAARMLQGRDDIRFVICGEGPNRKALETLATGLSNIEFHDLQPKEHLADLLDLATLHVVPQIAGAADLMLPSKLCNMLASGKPIVATAAPGTGLQLEVEGCGLVTPPGDVAAMARAIETLVDQPELRKTFGEAARVRCEQRWQKNPVLLRFCRHLEAAVALKTVSRARAIQGLQK